MMFENWGFVNPWREMDRMLGEMGVFRSPFARPYRKASGAVDNFPRVNMWSNDEEIQLAAELPGVDPADLSIQAVEDTVAIEGKRPAPEIEEKGTLHRQERASGHFKRLFQLPFKIEVEKVEARCEKGILYVRLPRSEKEKPRKIEVKVS